MKSKNFKDTLIRHCFSLLPQKARRSLLNCLRASKTQYIMSYDRVTKSYIIWIPEEAKIR